MTNELSMGETTINAAAEDKPLDAATFDVAKWIEGVQPTRRATTVFSRCDLLADLDLIKEEMVRAKTAGNTPAVTELRAKAQALVDELNATAVDVVVEAWSADKLKDFHAQARDAGMSDEEAGMAQVAAQIVAPEGFTSEMLQTLMEVSPTQVQAIIGITVQANNAAPVVAVPF